MGASLYPSQPQQRSCYRHPENLYKARPTHSAPPTVPHPQCPTHCTPPTVPHPLYPTHCTPPTFVMCFSFFLSSRRSTLFSTTTILLQVISPTTRHCKRRGEGRRGREGGGREGEGRRGREGEGGVGGRQLNHIRIRSYEMVPEYTTHLVS